MPQFEIKDLAKISAEKMQQINQTADIAKFSIVSENDMKALVNYLSLETTNFHCVELKFEEKAPIEAIYKLLSEFIKNDKKIIHLVINQSSNLSTLINIDELHFKSQIELFLPNLAKNQTLNFLTLDFTSGNYEIPSDFFKKCLETPSLWKVTLRRGEPQACKSLNMQLQKRSKTHFYTTNFSSVQNSVRFQLVQKYFTDSIADLKEFLDDVQRINEIEFYCQKISETTPESLVSNLTNTAVAMSWTEDKIKKLKQAITGKSFDNTQQRRDYKELLLRELFNEKHRIYFTHSDKPIIKYYIVQYYESLLQEIYPDLIKALSEDEDFTEIKDNWLAYAIQIIRYQFSLLMHHPQHLDTQDEATAGLNPQTVLDHFRTHFQRLADHQELIAGLKDGGKIPSWPNDARFALQKKLIVEKDPQSRAIFSYLCALQELIFLKDAKTPLDFIKHSFRYQNYLTLSSPLPAELEKEIIPEIKEYHKNILLSQKEKFHNAFVFLANPDGSKNRTYYQRAIMILHDLQHHDSNTTNTQCFKFLAEAFKGMLKILINHEKKPPCFMELTQEIFANLGKYSTSVELGENYNYIFKFLSHQKILGPRENQEDFIKIFRKTYKEVTTPKLEQVYKTTWWGKDPVSQSTPKVVDNSQEGLNNNITESRTGKLT